MPTGTKPEPSSFTKAIARRVNSEKNMTNVELARRTGISRPHLIKMLSGGKHWDVDQLDIICATLGLDIVEVIATAEKEARPETPSNVTRLRQNLNLEEIDLNGFDKAANHNNHDSGEPETP